MSSGVDPVIGVAQVLAIFVGASTAALVAPHLVVIIAGIAGGILGLMSWRPCTSFEAIRYVCGMCALSWLFAGSASEIISIYAAVEDKRIVSPIALAIGWTGHRWPKIAIWFVKLARTFIETAIKGKPSA